MKDLGIVASYTFKEMVKRKSFLISNLIILLLIVIGFNIPNLLNSIKGDEVGSDKILIVDSENVFNGNLEALKSMDLGYSFEIINEATEFSTIKEKIQKEEVGDALVITTQNGQVHIQYVVKNIGMGTQVPDSIMNVLSQLYSNTQMEKMGLTQAQIASTQPNFELELKQIEEKEVKGNLLVIMLMSIVLFYAIYFCAYQVSTSITTEKTSKIMETLVTSTTPRTIVVGKTLGIGLAGILQIVAIVVVAILSAKFFLPEGMLESALDLSQITPMLGILTFVYFILGYVLYAFLYALTGSTVSKPEDIQSANTPIAILAVVGFYLAYFTMMNPTSSLNSFAAIFPISAPFCVPFRIMMGLATTSEIAISLAIMIITIAIVAQISIKIYSSAILNYGSKLSFKDMVKIYKDKNNEMNR